MIPDDWIENPPEDLETQVEILEENAHNMTRKDQIGDTLRLIFNRAKEFYNSTLDLVKQQEPQAYWKPSYEQALMLNSWCYGINFVICFSANRIGKTTALLFNLILWIFPNNPDWVCFKPYIDHLGRTVYLIPRPSIRNIIPLQRFYEKYPELVGDPLHQPYEDCNVAKWNTTKAQLNNLLDPCWPYPPITKGGTIWLGAPDYEFHNSIVRKRLRELLPSASILKDSDADLKFIITTASTTNPKTTAFEIISKSYDSKDTKWSGDAVTGIAMTEGFSQEILDEVKLRLINESFASWDYTPYEPRNTGRKTALAYKVFKGEEELPLRNYVYTRFSVRNSPEHIIPREKREDLIRMYDGTDAGKARLDGDFFASSGLVLDSLRRDFHCLDWSLQRLQSEVPGGQFYRGLDPGYDHPTACCWGYLAPNNDWFIYRFYSKRGTSIPERCKDIIALSNNARESIPSKYGERWQEVHHRPDSEVYIATVADYHIFKTDENTKTPYASLYASQGLPLTESTHMRPEERGLRANGLLNSKNYPHKAHPVFNKPPGSRVYFLVNEFGVASALDKFDQLFWERYQSGDNAGEPKDKIPIHGDDELDAFCYLVCGPYVYTQYRPKPKIPRENQSQHDPYSVVGWLEELSKPPVTAGFH